jgi:hypothetical protein
MSSAFISLAIWVRGTGWSKRIFYSLRKGNSNGRIG